MKLLTLILLITSLTIDANVNVEESPFKWSPFYTNEKIQKETGVIVLHGSEGGKVFFTQLDSIYLASQGFKTLSLCYIDCGKDSPFETNFVHSVPVEYLNKAVKWLRNNEGIKKVSIIGFSRGAEFAALYAQKFNDVELIVLNAVTHILETPYSPNWHDYKCWLDDKKWNPKCGTPPIKRNKTSTKSPWTFKNHHIELFTPINLKDFKGKVLITHGAKDSLWKKERAQKLFNNTNQGLAKLILFENDGHILSFKSTNKRRSETLKMLNSL